MLDLKNTSLANLNHTELEDLCKSCNLCSLAKNRTNTVFSSGPIPAKIMAIGEAPGEEENLQGKPFVGEAGLLLEKIFDSINIKLREDLYITNLLKCHPPDNRTPLPEEIKSCRNYLLAQIQLVQPKIIILIGNSAFQNILQVKTSISNARGNWYKIKVNYMSEDLYLMPVFHPSYLLQNSSKKPDSPKWLTWQDFKEIKAALDFYKNK
jgi:uracil-DNA glycosylase